MKAIIIGMGRSGKCAMYALKDLGYELAVQDSKDADKAEPEVREYCREHGIKEYYGDIRRPSPIVQNRGNYTSAAH